jgi:uncharacterized protein (DUF885 family)
MNTRAFLTIPTQDGLTLPPARIFSQAILGLALVLCLPGQASADATTQLSQLKARALEGLFRSKPHLASFMGEHRYDGQLPDFSDRSLKRRSAEIASQLTELARIPRKELTAEDNIDAEILAEGLGLEQLYLREIRDWEWDPRLHDSFPPYDPREFVAERLGGLMHGEFAPYPRRLAALTALLNALPRLLEQYQKQLKNPPQLYTMQAIKDNAGRLELCQTEVAQFIARSSEASTKKTSTAARLSAEAALKAYQVFLEKDLLPRSKGDFKLGATRYAHKFPLALATDLTPAQAVAHAQRSFETTRRELYALALKLHAQLFPTAKPPNARASLVIQGEVIRKVRQELGADHPAPSALVASHGAGIDRLRAFITKHDLLALPSKETLTVTATPLFKRGVSGAEYLAPNMLDASAPYHGTYYVDPVDPSWPKEKVESYLRANNTAANELTAIHEAYPGHHTQGWYAKQKLNPLRTVFWNAPMVEGWAVYGQDLMVNLGWGGAKNDRYRFLTLLGHLVVAANLILDVKLQSGQMTDDEALRFMVEEGYQEKAMAEKKLVRAKLDSTQLAQYFLGWDAIVELERDYKAKVGKAYSQRRFDEALVGHGSISVKYLRPIVMSRP